MKKIIISLLLCFTVCNVFGEKTLNVTVENQSEKDKTNAPVVIKLDSYGIDVKSALVTLDGKEIACQLDDINQDGTMDELCFLVDIAKKSSQEYSIALYDNGKAREYEPQVYVEMLLSNKKVKETNKQDLYISSLTVDKDVNPYWMIHHHGAAFENEMVAYRIYFDHRQTVDLYGKFNKQLELKQTQFYPDEEQKATGFGDDVLWAGSTLGGGTFRGWDGTQPVMLTDVDKRSQTIISRGPLRTIVEVKDKGWIPAPGKDPIDMSALYILYAGNRACDVDVNFDRPVPDYSFVAGFINVKNSTEYSDGNGVRGCWGTDWPVEGKDTLVRSKETVGLAIYVPKEYNASEEPANKDNYAYVMKTATDEMHYKISFCSDNETFGYHSDKEWFNALKEWREDIDQPLIVKINN